MTALTRSGSASSDRPSGWSYADSDSRLFDDTIGPDSGHWWDLDLLGRIRGADGAGGTVRRPYILNEARRGVLVNLYAVGGYQPWHQAGASTVFTRYLRALKQGGSTVEYAAILLRQGLAGETSWIADIDVVVPMATSMRSFEAREFELTEDLHRDLAWRLCIPFVDAFEVDPEAAARAPREATRRGPDTWSRAFA